MDKSDYLDGVHVCGREDERRKKEPLPVIDFDMARALWRLKGSAFIIIVATLLKLS